MNILNEETIETLKYILEDGELSIELLERFSADGLVHTLIDQYSETLQQFTILDLAYNAGLPKESFPQFEKAVYEKIEQLEEEEELTEESIQLIIKNL